MDSQIKKLIHGLETAFGGKPWYGTSVMQKLESIDWHLVNERPKGYSKSIADLVVHIINWRIFALKKMDGDQDFDIEINGARDWSETNIKNEREWQARLEVLRENQSAMIQRLSKRSDAFLRQTVPGKSETYYDLVEGIVQHDIYHLGQIAMINSVVRQ